MIDLGPLGDRAFLARFADEEGAARWARSVRARGGPGVVDVVLAYRSVAVFADPDRIDLDALEARLRDEAPNLGDEPGEPAASIVLPVLYDGEDLPEVSRRLGLAAPEVVAEHARPEYRVLAVGFLPGFPYAGPLPDTLTGLARRESPRVRVPAGSVAIAGRQTGVYPTDSPGGWHLIGRTPLKIADLERGRFPIRAGDRLRFAPIDRDEFEARRGAVLDRPG